MIKSYFRIALRNLARNKIYTFINVLGLALGICACLVIGLIVKYEFSFDRNHPDKDRIYRINTYVQYMKEEPVITQAAVYPTVPGIVRKQVPGIETVAPYHILSDVQVRLPEQGSDRAALPSAPILTGPEYFSIMKYEWLAGNERTALEDPFKVVLSEKTAYKYFGAGPLDGMIGRQLIYEDSLHVSVAGIVKDWQENTDFPYTEFISLSTADHSSLRQELQLDQIQLKGVPHTSRVLLKLAKSTNPASVDAAIAGLFPKKLRMALQPLTSIHFTDPGNSAEISMAHLPTLYALISIAIFILLLAVINYVNLATAQSLTRDKEIGIRKVLGSGRGSLILQFLSETFLLALFAMALASLLVRPVLAAFHSFIPPAVKFDPFSPGTLLFMAGISIVTSLLAGLYPARLLSSYQPVQILRGAGAPKGSEKWWLRKGLIVFQFSISLVFIIGTLVIGRQIRYMLTNDLGFRSDAIVLFDTNDSRDSISRVKLIAEKIAALPGINGVARENMPPMGLDRGMFGIQYKPRGDERLTVAGIKADENFIPLYDIRLLAGRNLLPSDTLKEVVINESLVKKLGFASPEKAIGQMIFTWNKFVPIVGVVADFHQASFRETVKPMLIAAMACTDIAVRLDTKGRSATEARTILARVEQQWKSIYPHQPFEYTFLDESLAQLYKKEQTTAWLMNIATGITIFISCIGLFGLTMFTMERRTKEIGIRKVMGASVPDIGVLLVREFVALVAISILIASPVAWYFMNGWLQDFAYRIPFGPDIFLLAGAAILLITLLTVGFQAAKAALANPIKSLRTE